MRAKKSGECSATSSRRNVSLGTTREERGVVGARGGARGGQLGGIRKQGLGSIHFP